MLAACVYEFVQRYATIVVRVNFVEQLAYVLVVLPIVVERRARPARLASLKQLEYGRNYGFEFVRVNEPVAIDVLFYERH